MIQFILNVFTNINARYDLMFIKLYGHVFLTGGEQFPNLWSLLHVLLIALLVLNIYHVITS